LDASQRILPRRATRGWREVGTLRSWVSTFGGAALAIVAMRGADEIVAGCVLGLGIAIACRLYRPTKRRCAAALIVMGMLAGLAVGLDVRLVRSLWPAGEGVEAVSVLVARMPGFAPRRGDLIAWRLEGTTAPEIVAVDRVLALTGEFLRVSDGTASAVGEGHACHALPVLGVRHEWAVDLRIGTQEWGVIASTVNWRPTGPDSHRAQAQAIADGARVRSDQILGRALLVRAKGRTWAVP